MIGRLLLVAALVAGCTATPAGTPSPSAATVPGPRATAPATPSPTPSGQLAFEVQGGLATIRIREQLVSWTFPGDAILTAKGVKGSFALAPDGSFDPGSLLQIELASIESDEPIRADAARETMRASLYPTADVRPIRALGLPVPLPENGDWTFQLIGALSVNGQTRELTWDVQASRGSDGVKAVATTSFTFGHFGMEVPRRGPVLSIVDEIRLSVEIEASREDSAAACVATPQDAPANYKAGAPERSVIGSGYVFTGTVRSVGACRPISGARVELWLANPDGVYDDAHRATLFADPLGRFRLETTPPAAYGGGRAHIHIKVTAPGHADLVSVHFPEPGAASGDMELVLAPR